MFDRLVEDFFQFDDFCQGFYPRWEAWLLTEGSAPSKKRGPEAGVADSEIMTIVVLYHSSHFKNFKTFYEGVVLALLRSAFPKAPCYARFIALTSHVWVPLTVFLLSRMGRRTGIYYIDSTALPVCHDRRIDRHKVFTDLATRGKTSIGWFFGFKLHLVFNHERQIVALKLTSGNVNDTTPVPDLTQDLIGKLFGDKGYVGKDLAERLLRRGLALMTRVRRNMSFKLHLVFNHERQIVALKLTPGNVNDTTPVPDLTEDLIGKLFGDKGYVGKDLAERLRRRGLALMTRVRRNIKRLPVSFF